MNTLAHFRQPLRRTRTESLYMALKNEKFLEHRLKPGHDDAVDRVRNVLIKDYWNRRLETRMDARAAIETVCDVCQNELGISGTAVVMEYIWRMQCP